MERQPLGGYYHYRLIGFGRLLRRLIGRRVRIILIGRRPLRGTIVSLGRGVVIITPLGGGRTRIPLRNIGFVAPI